MASTQKRGSTWYAKFVDADGKTIRRATTASTKKACEALAYELESQAERQKLGLIPRQVTCTMTLGALCEWWATQRCPPASAGKERSRLGKHIVKKPIGALVLTQITPAVFDAHLRELEAAGGSAGSVNKLRAIVRCAFAAGIEADLWGGPNPIERVKARRVPQRIYETLRVHEVAGVLVAAGRWRNLTAVALFLGLRKGELFALRRADVNLDERVIYVRRSHGRDTVKGGKAVALPIPTPLVPYLQDALQESGSDFVFPGLDGKRLPEHTAMEKIFRRILSRAGIITGWKHTCRRCAARKEPTVEQHADGTLRACPKCGAKKMWPSAIPRQMRFQDCRHTAITLLLQMGVAPQFVQRIARHANIRTTLETYGHLVLDDLRGPLEAFGKAASGPEKPPPKAPSAKALRACGTSAQSNLGPTEVQAGENPKKRGPGPQAKTLEDRALEIGAEHQIRTGDLRLGKATLYQLS